MSWYPWTSFGVPPHVPTPYMRTWRRGLFQTSGSRRGTHKWRWLKREFQSSIYGPRFDDEVRSKLGHDRRGVIRVSNTGRNTNGFQLFITMAEVLIMRAPVQGDIATRRVRIPIPTGFLYLIKRIEPLYAYRRVYPPVVLELHPSGQSKGEASRMIGRLRFRRWSMASVGPASFVFGSHVCSHTFAPTFGAASRTNGVLRHTLDDFGCRQV